MEEEVYLSCKEVAERYRVDVDSVRRWCRQKKLDAVALGGVWRITARSVDDCIADSTRHRRRGTSADDELLERLREQAIPSRPRTEIEALEWRLQSTRDPDEGSFLRWVLKRKPADNKKAEQEEEGPQEYYPNPNLDR